jgi:hypothetical protein
MRRVHWGFCLTNMWRASASLWTGLGFDRFKPTHERGIFKCISWLNGLIFGGDNLLLKIHMILVQCVLCQQGHPSTYDNKVASYLPTTKPCIRHRIQFVLGWRLRYKVHCWIRTSVQDSTTRQKWVRVCFFHSFFLFGTKLVINDPC